MAWGSGYDPFANRGTPGPPAQVGKIYTPPTPSGTTTTAIGGSGGEPGTKIPDGGGGGVPGYSGPMSPNANFDPVPVFNFQQFKAPTIDEARNEAGYQFREEEGRRALERSAAAKGVLRTGGHLTDVLKYGQNFAQAEYSNVFERALRGYGAYYQGAKDRFAPQLSEWTTKANWERQRAIAEFNRYLEASGMAANSASQANANANTAVSNFT